MPNFDCEACEQLVQRLGAARVKSGKQAVRRPDRDQLALDADCSVDLESLERPAGEKAFDYLLVLRPDCGQLFAEVHPASSTSQVDEVIQKRKGTTAALRRKGFTPGGRWVWLVPGTGTVAFKATDRHGKRLALAGIEQPRRKLSR